MLEEDELGDMNAEEEEEEEEGKEAKAEEEEEVVSGANIWAPVLRRAEDKSAERPPTKGDCCSTRRGKAGRKKGKEINYDLKSVLRWISRGGVNGEGGNGKRVEESEWIGKGNRWVIQRQTIVFYLVLKEGFFKRSLESI